MTSLDLMMTLIPTDERLCCPSHSIRILFASTVIRANSMQRGYCLETSVSHIASVPPSVYMSPSGALQMQVLKNASTENASTNL